MLTWIILIAFLAWAGFGAKFTYDFFNHFKKKYKHKGFYSWRNKIMFDEEDNQIKRTHFKKIALLFVAMFLLIFFAFFINAVWYK